MDDHTDAHDDAHSGDEHGHDVEGLDRVTSPMQDFSMSQVGIGFAVMVVGVLVAFVVPFLAV
ncbi:DUF7550 family protein [Halorussus halophilus]|uniref:DUF7550 family protein n=1 Tax=Halorussus halophilus TaxID=2650975 RepID=UPI00130117EB|nr:hypothetical protein [Halorussus halophilus]